MKNKKNTYYLSIIILFFLTLQSVCLTAQTEVNRLTLKDVIYIARQQSPDALIAKHKFRRSYWEFKTYKAAYLPSLKLDGEIPKLERLIEGITQPDGSEVYKETSSTKYSAKMSINQTIGFTGGSLFLSSGIQRLDDFGDSTVISYLSTPINIGYSQPIFKYNPYKWDRKIEPLKYDEAKRTYLENVEQILITATNFFFNLLLAQIEKDIAKKNLHNYDTLYHIARGRYNLGKIAENELLQLELNLLKAQASVDNSDLNYENHLFLLKSYLRIKDDYEIILIPPTKTWHSNIDVNKAIYEAKENTSAGLAFQRRLLEAESEVNFARMDKRFDAEIYAVFGLTQTSDYIKDAYRNPLDQQQVTLGIHLPILDWGLAKGRIKMAESSQELVKTAVEQERIDFEQNIFLNVMQFNMQKNQLKIAAKSDTVAQKRFEVTQQRYLIGKVNDVLELNNAQIDNDNAKKSYFSALQNYWINYFELRRLTLYDFKNDRLILFNINDIQ